MLSKYQNNYKNIKKLTFISLVVVAVFVADFTSSIPKAHAAAINGITNVQVTPSTYQYTTFKGVPVYRLDITNSGDAPDTLVSLAPTPVGNVVDTLISLHFYKDANNNGIVDQGDTDLGGSSSFASDNTKKTFTLTSPLAIPVGVTHILITADGGPALGNAQTFQLAFALSTDVVMGTVQITPAPGSNMPNSHDITISSTAPSLAITNGANDPIAKTATASQTGVVVKQLTFTAQATSDSIRSIAMTPGGTQNATNVASTKFYIDLGTPGVIDGNGADILLPTTPTTYTTNGITTFTFLSPFLIPGGTAVNILYTYNLGAGVVVGNTLTARLVATTDAVAGSGITVSSNGSGVSALITIGGGANIVIASAKINSANTVLVTLANPGYNLASVDYTKWHIDVGDDGLSPFNPDSAAVTSAGTPWTITLTYNGAPFRNPAAAYVASGGLYADASAVTDTNSDTNVVVGYAASIAITDGQAPTTPIADPIAGAYTSTQSVTLSSTGFTSIRFTTDGTSIGDCSSGSLYSGAISVSSSETIQAVGCDDAGNISPLGTFAYTISSPSFSTPGSHRRVYNPNLYTTATTTIVVQNIPQNISVPIFQRTLNTGMVGDDIKTLQQYLNNNGFILAPSGPGSSGQETTYFGPLTKAALIKFQEAHKDKILTPLGLTNGTGYFGPSTKAFINGF